MSTSVLSKLHRPPTGEGIDVGGRLKGLRQKLGLSQRDLAQMAGVTNGMISSIEQNKHSPSVSSLKKITDALNLSIAEFFLEQPVESEQVFFTSRELDCIEESGLRFQVIAGNRREKAMQIMREVYAPGAETGPEMLSHAGEEGGMVLEGEIEISVGDQVRILKAGDSYYFDSRAPHRFRNCSDCEVTVISACTPPSL